MKQVELEYVEVLNETEQIFIFTTIFNGKKYANTLIINMALPVGIQDTEISNAVNALATMNREVASKAETIKVPCANCSGNCSCKRSKI